MASIPCATYQASTIHGNLRKQYQEKRRRQLSGDSEDSNTPPASPVPSPFTDVLGTAYKGFENFKKRMNWSAQVATKDLDVPVVTTSTDNSSK